MVLRAKNNISASNKVNQGNWSLFGFIMVIIIFCLANDLHITWQCGRERSYSRMHKACLQFREFKGFGNFSSL